MSEESMVPASMLRKARKDIEQLDENYRARVQNQIDIINRLQTDLGVANGFRLIASVLLDKLFEEESLKSYSIAANEITETDPRVWKMESVQSGSFFIIHKVELPPPPLETVSGEPPEEPKPSEDSADLEDTEGSDQYNVGE